MIRSAFGDATVLRICPSLRIFCKSHRLALFGEELESTKKVSRAAAMAYVAGYNYLYRWTSRTFTFVKLKKRLRVGFA